MRVDLISTNSHAAVLWGFGAAMKQKRKDAPEKGKDPDAKNRDTKQTVEHLVPDFLVRGQFVGSESDSRRHKKREDPQKPRVTREECLLASGLHITPPTLHWPYYRQKLRLPKQ